MTTAVDHILGKLQRTLSEYERRHPNGGVYRVTAINEPYIGERLEGCEVLERVGQGAMSVVYRARQDYTERIVAIKMLRAQLCTDNNNVKRFQREAKAIARLNHPNLVNVYGVGKTRSGQPYIVMDFVQGKSLGDLIAQEGQIGWQRVGQIFLQVCDAMQHAHANRIIHRDLKPDNIMLVNHPERQDWVKVVDFGIVKLTDESQALSQRLTQTGEVWGSPLYMSPEQCMGNELDARSDVYSLGVVLYESLTGRQVFEGKTITEVVMKQLNHPPQPFSAVRPDLAIPPWLEQVTMKALAKEPYNRFASMEEMKRTIERGLLTDKDTADAVLKPPKDLIVSAAAAAAAVKTDPYIGELIGGKFLVESLIGDGGMSVVYRAVQQGINRPVAIKILRDELCDDEANCKRFQREAKSVSRLTHPNLVAIHDVGTLETGQPYMVMEFLAGKSLAETLAQEGPLSVQRALPIFMQICEVMHYAHSQGFVHRDLKPHNIMLTKVADRPDFVKLVDFGIVKLDGIKQAISQRLTAAGEICGSPIYMSPEQVLDEPVDARSDIYSFGIVMYECLAGRPVFGGKKITDVLHKHVNVLPEPFSESAPKINVPPVLEGIIFKTLEKNPTNRFQSMDSLKEALDSVSRRMLADPDGFQSDQLPILQRREIQRTKEASGKQPTRNSASGSLPTTKAASGKHPTEEVRRSTGNKSNVALIAVILLAVCAIAGGIALLGHFGPKPAPQLKVLPSMDRNPPADTRKPKVEVKPSDAGNSTVSIGGNKPDAPLKAPSQKTNKVSKKQSKRRPRAVETDWDVLNAEEQANVRSHKTDGLGALGE